MELDVCIYRVRSERGRGRKVNDIVTCPWEGRVAMGGMFDDWNREVAPDVVGRTVHWKMGGEEARRGTVLELFGLSVRKVAAGAEGSAGVIGVEAEKSEGQGVGRHASCRYAIE